MSPRRRASSRSAGYCCAALTLTRTRTRTLTLTSISRLLLRGGGAVDAASHMGHTPLHLAAEEVQLGAANPN